MKRALFWIAAFFAACHAGCGTGPAPIPTTADCASACGRGKQLNCDWALPTPLGVECEVVCENAARRVPWSVACISTAATCEEADHCP